MIKPLFFEEGEVRIIDQTALPHEYRKMVISDHIEMGEAIRSLRIRGAPAIGIAAAYGLCLGLRKAAPESKERLLEKTDEICRYLISMRPTAVNLSWALQRMRKALKRIETDNPEEITEFLFEEAGRIHEEDIAMCEAIAENGFDLMPESGNVLTHCNTGGLATGGLGTALGVIIRAYQKGKDIHVYADETRPLLQGARLTMWELQKEKVPSTLITDGSAAYLMSQGKVDCVIVGADRIASNGDTANKIGTLSAAILARNFGIPFYVAAPSSTIDTTIRDGELIPIEMRNGDEIRKCSGKMIAPEGVDVWAPAFDVTPAALIEAIITEKDVFRYPYAFNQ